MGSNTNSYSIYMIRYILMMNRSVIDLKFELLSSIRISKDLLVTLVIYQISIE